MAKILKRILVTVLVIALLVGGVYGGLRIYKTTQAKPVGVYPVSSFSMTDYWGDESEAYGTVTTDKVQNVFLSDTQTVTEIFVTEGQEVKEGDPLCSFDTTLSDIDLEKAQISEQKLEQQLETAKKEQTDLQNMVPGGIYLVTPETREIEYDTRTTPSYISGSGREDDPIYILWGEEDSLSFAKIREYVGYMDLDDPAEPADETESAAEEDDGDTGESEDETVDRNHCYIALVTREHDALNGMITNTLGLCVDVSSEELSFKVTDPNLSEEILAYDENPEPYYVSYGSLYTADELAELRSDKEKEIRDLEIQIQLAEVELERLQAEVNDGIVYSKFDGSIKKVADPDEAQANGEAFLTVSGGGGFYITVAMSEMELDTMQLGQTVTVYSWRNGMNYEGSIVDISDYPTDSADSYSSGNTNVSYYPFTVFVGEDAELEENEYVSISYSAANTGDNGFYLESMFVRSEGGKSYVYVQNEDGRLEQRTVQTGKTLWGSYTQIRGGITLDDYLAFPYGTEVKEGAETEIGDIETFYSTMY